MTEFILRDGVIVYVNRDDPAQVRAVAEKSLEMAMRPKERKNNAEVYRRSQSQG